MKEPVFEENRREMESLDLYSDPCLVALCQMFYDKYYDTERIMNKLNPVLEKLKYQKVLFIGPLSNVARELALKNTDLTLVDYSPEMLAQAHSRLFDLPICLEQADVRHLPEFRHKFDLIIMPGRVTAYLLTDDDVSNALNSLNKSRSPGGNIVFDFFDAEKIRSSVAFNGRVQAGGIVRESKTEFLKNDPYLTAKWQARYSIDGGESFSMQAPHKIRSFTEPQMQNFLQNNGITNAEFHDSFEEDSKLVVI